MMMMTTRLRRFAATMIYPEAIEERRNLERAVNYDFLTGFPNRRAFDLSRPAAEADSSLAVIVFDLNNFGQVNKIRGHLSGDFMLLAAAEALASAVTEFQGSRVFRFGGDEFVAYTNKFDAIKFITRASENFGRHVLENGAVVSMTGSAGDTFDEADSHLQRYKTASKLLDAE